MQVPPRTLMLAINRRVTLFSYQSLMPVDAGAPRIENPELRFFTAISHGEFCHAPPQTPAGDKPPHYISPDPPLWIPAFAGMTDGAPE